MKAPIRPALIALTLAATSIAHGQAIGWRSGHVTSNVTWEAQGCCTSWGNEPRVSGAAMWTVRLDVHKYFAIESGRGYVRKGYNVTKPQIHSTYDEVPVTLIVQSGRRTAVFGGFGVVFSRMTQCERTVGLVGEPKPSCGETVRNGVAQPAIASRDLSRSIIGGLRVSVWRFNFTLSSSAEVSIRDNDGPDGERMLNTASMQMLGVEFRLR